MIYTDPAAAAPAIAERIAKAQRILILTHVNPDGDAVGSLLGMWHALRALGKQATALASPPLPAYCQWLPGVDQIELYARGAPLPPCDLAIMVDTASTARIGPIASDHADALAALPLIIIDHHVTNDGAGSVNLIAPAAASTCELLHDLLIAMGVPIDPDLASCLLLGHTTDTQSFQTSSTSGAALRVAAHLVDLGADQRGVVSNVYYALPGSSAVLVGMGLAAMRYDEHIAWTTVTQAMMRESGAEEEAVDEVVRVMQRIAGIRALVLFKERADATTKISLRSRPPIDVARFAQRWGGGGHAQASGATLAMPPAEAERIVVPLLRELVTLGG